jgi:hypothetical protein
VKTARFSKTLATQPPHAAPSDQTTLSATTEYSWKPKISKPQLTLFPLKQIFKYDEKRKQMEIQFQYINFKAN